MKYKDYYGSEEEYMLGLIFDKSFREKELYFNRSEEYFEATKEIRNKKRNIYAKSEKGKRTRRLYNQSERGKRLIRKIQRKSKRKQLKKHKTKLIHNLRKRIYFILKGTDKVLHSKEFLDCSPEFLKLWLELQFTEGMSWDNYGRGCGKWSIDHIRPCTSFDFIIPEHQTACFHYTNLQPLWCVDNSSKGNNFSKKLDFS